MNYIKDIAMKYMSTTGRAGRFEFWAVVFVAGVIVLAPTYILFAPDSKNADTYVNISSLIVAWPTMAAQVRRWHDRNKSASWLVLNVVPIIGTIWIIVELGFFAGVDLDGRCIIDMC